MQNITIGRYDGDLTQEYAGWVEGQSETGTGWILWLDGSGTPAVYWPSRTADGAVVGDPITL